ncbi:hypothetical protein J6590_097421 [Homalodisca vitripennis]|nr:hypothetical protein J6590_097421 [Homalodisca vitripennis]
MVTLRFNDIVSLTAIYSVGGTLALQPCFSSVTESLLLPINLQVRLSDNSCNDVLSSIIGHALVPETEIGSGNIRLYETSLNGLR